MPLQNTDEIYLIGALQSIYIYLPLTISWLWCSTAAASFLAIQV